MIPDVAHVLPCAGGIATPNGNSAPVDCDELTVRAWKSHGAIRGCVPHGAILAHCGIQGLPADMESRRSKALGDVVSYGFLASDDRSPRRNNGRFVAPERRPVQRLFRQMLRQTMPGQFGSTLPSWFPPAELNLHLKPNNMFTIRRRPSKRGSTLARFSDATPRTSLSNAIRLLSGELVEPAQWPLLAALGRARLTTRSRSELNFVSPAHHSKLCSLVPNLILLQHR